MEEKVREQPSQIKKRVGQKVCWYFVLNSLHKHLIIQHLKRIRYTAVGTLANGVRELALRDHLHTHKQPDRLNTTSPATKPEDH